jgi:peroxiredoxin
MNIEELLIDFELQSVSGEQINTKDLSKKSALLIVVTCNHCPYALAYWNRIIKLAKTYEDDNMSTIAICGNNTETHPGDSFENMQTLSKKFNLPFEYLHDPSQHVIKQLGAERTPEVFLFNKERQLVYKGSIDDNWENANAVMRAHLEDAIEYCLDSSEIDHPETPAVGCSIKWLPENMPI